jgi:hypothetical protein
LAQQNPFAGTWKFNPAKSRLSGQTVTYTAQGSGFAVKSGAVTFTLMPDGKDHPGPFQDTANAFKQIDPHTWEQVSKLKGRTMATSRFVVSGDERTLTVTTDGTRPDGERLHNVTVFERLGQEGPRQNGRARK